MPKDDVNKTALGGICMFFSLGFFTPWFWLGGWDFQRGQVCAIWFGLVVIGAVAMYRMAIWAGKQDG